MTLTAPRGFAGGGMADIDYGIGAAGGAWVESATAFAVTQPNTAVRSVSVAVGTGAAFGIRVTNDAAIAQSITPPGSGGGWYLLTLRFDWTAKTTSLQVIAGATTGSTTAPTDIPAVPGSNYYAAPGGIYDMPLAWVWASSSSTTLTIFDLRMRSLFNEPSAMTLQALKMLASQFTPPAGFQIPCADGITYRWNGTAWRAWDSDWVAYTPGASNFTFSTTPGANTGRYRLRGGKVMVQYFLTIATMTGSTPSIGLPPVAAETVTSGAVAVGNLWAVQGTNRYFLVPELVGAGAFRMRYLTNSGLTLAILSNTAPATWAAGDGFYGSFEYDPA